MFSRRPRRGLFGKLFLSFTSVFIITACVVVAVAYFIQRPVGSGIGELSDSPAAQRSLGTLAPVLRYGGPEPRRTGCAREVPISSSRLSTSRTNPCRTF